MEEDTITIVENDKIPELVGMVMRQTDYTKEESIEQLKLYNYDVEKVIKKYLGISEPKPQCNKVNLNQEIYKQMRFKLDNAMRDYNERKENNETKLK